MKLEALVGGRATVVGPETTLGEAADILVSDGLGSLGVVDEGRLVGIVTERDIVRAIARGVETEDAEVSDWMSDAPDTVDPEVEVEEAAAWLLEMGYRHLPVMRDGELLGIVSMRDVLWAILGGGVRPTGDEA
jgi:CBS domain-containing protein